MSFETKYEDNGAIKYAVRFRTDRDGKRFVDIEYIDRATFPIEDLDWLIDALREIQHTVKHGGIT